MAKMKVYERTITKTDGNTVTDLQQASKEADVSWVAIGYGADAQVTAVNLAD